MRAKDEWVRAILEDLVSAEASAYLAALPTERLWSAAVAQGYVTDAQVVAAVAERFRLGIAALDRIAPEAIEVLPEALARRYGVVPLTVTDTTIDVATADPLDLDCERTLAFAVGRTVRFRVAAPAALARRLDDLYPPRDDLRRFVRDMAGTYGRPIADAPAADRRDPPRLTAMGDRPLIQLVDRLIAEAVRCRASDIHLEPTESGVAVRHRVDGVLRQTMVVPPAVKDPLLSRVKIMAQLDIADRLRPQDGRMRVVVEGKGIDLRVSTLPAAQGEKIVLRILDQSTTVLSLEALGLLESESRALTTLLEARDGMVLVTGPTGSGKTTTLYSILQAIKARGVNIITVEDPVEYRLPGIVQVQVHEKAGLTFPSALRSILRQDPDVILIGEIRDRETAQIAVQAALTGHLVLSTLHTNDAASSITRLTDLGVEGYKIAAALKGIVAQRLVRRLCPRCKAPAPATVLPDHLRPYLPPDAEVRRAVGCDDCAMTGYRGRHAIHEMLTVGGDLPSRIASGEPIDRLLESAQADGMRSLWDSGIAHVIQGDTTLAELLRVLEAPPAPPPSVSPVSSVSSVPAGPRPVPSVTAVPHVVTPTDPSADRGLLVEADEPLRREMRDLLERDGFVILEARDGVHADDPADPRRPEAMNLTLHLPRRDAAEALQRLRAVLRRTRRSHV